MGVTLPRWILAVKSPSHSQRWNGFLVDGLSATLPQSRHSGGGEVSVERLLAPSSFRPGGHKGDIHLIKLEGILLVGSIGRHGPVAIQDIADEGRFFGLG
jgi:hypothetical protein